jgi:hypothetical protein
LPPRSQMVGRRLDRSPSEQLLERTKGLAKDVVIASPHMLFPGLGHLHKEGNGYSWAPVAFTDLWAER